MFPSGMFKGSCILTRKLKKEIIIIITNVRLMYRTRLNVPCIIVDCIVDRIHQCFPDWSVSVEGTECSFS